MCNILHCNFHDSKNIFKGKALFERTKEEAYRKRFYQVKAVNLVGVICMCAAFISAAVISEKHVLGTLILLFVVILMVLIPKIIIQNIWKCPHCDAGLSIGVNRGINVRLLARCPDCQRILCEELYKENQGK